VVNVGGSAYVLPENAGDTLTQQAAAWVTALNAATPFNQNYTAAASGAVILIFFKATDLGDSTPSFVTSSPHLTLTGAWPLRSIGTVALSGTPTAGETCSIGVASLAPIPLPQTAGSTLAQQAALWCITLNGTLSFQAQYVANNSGGVINIFANTLAPSGGVTLSATSSAHLALTAYGELQSHSQFLQSISDVVSDQIPAHARWYLTSE